MQCALVLVKTINLKITDTAYCVRKLYITIESGGYIYIYIGRLDVIFSTFFSNLCY